ncbi:MAG: sulfatase-like hydrolase/transferase, partial [Pseudomonadota bacterium]
MKTIKVSSQAPAASSPVQIRATYFGMIAEVDAQLGRIWTGLEAAGAWEDTLIVFTS